MFHLCKMAHSHSLDKTFDGMKDMEIIQNKKQTSSNAFLIKNQKLNHRTKKISPDMVWIQSYECFEYKQRSF